MKLLKAGFNLGKIPFELIISIIKIIYDALTANKEK